jgi:uncharacterized protein HemX
LVDEDKNFTPDAEQDFVAADDSDAGKPIESKKRGFGAWLGYGALLLMLVAIGAVVFWVLDLRSKDAGHDSALDKGDRRMLDLQQQVSSLQSEVATVHQQLVTVQSQVTTEESKFEREIGTEDSNFTDKLEAVRSDLNGSIQQIQRQLNQSRGDIMVADAEYLLSVANQKLHSL